MFRDAKRVLLEREEHGETHPWGWGKSAGGLAWVVIAHAGHMAPQDQLEVALDMLTKWLGGELMHQL